MLRAALLARTRLLLAAGGCGESGAVREGPGRAGGRAGGREGAAHRVLLVAQRQALQGRQPRLLLAGGERGAGVQHGGGAGSDWGPRGSAAPFIYPFELGATTPAGQSEPEPRPERGAHWAGGRPEARLPLWRQEEGQGGFGALAEATPTERASHAPGVSVPPPPRVLRRPMGPGPLSPYRNLRRCPQTP